MKVTLRTTVGAAVTAVMLAAGTLGFAASPASATTCTTWNNGRFICEYGISWHAIPGGRSQYYVVGTDYKVYTSWEGSPGGPKTKWYDLGGNARSSVIPRAVSGWTWQIWVVGADNPAHWYYRARHSNGQWDPWVKDGRA